MVYVDLPKGNANALEASLFDSPQGNSMEPNGSEHIIGFLIL